MHDALFAGEGKLDDLRLASSAKSFGLNEIELIASMAAPEVSAAVESDIAEAKRLKVTGTPTFFVGRIKADGRLQASARFAGAESLARFRAVLDGLINTK